MKIKTKIIICIFKIIKKIINNRFFKKYIYLSIEPNKFVLCNNKEYFLVNSSDHAIGKDTFVKGEFEFESMVKAYKIIKKKYKTLNNFTLLDIGSNIGSMCIPSITRNFVKDAVAIEPNPQSYQLLCSNIHLNNLSKKIITKQIGIGKLQKNLYLILNKVNHGDNKVSSKKIKNKKFVKINSITLDRLTENLNKKLIIKVDVQGSEALVLKYGKNTLSKKPPLILEFDPNLFTDKNIIEIENILKQSKYNFFYDLNNTISEKIKFNHNNYIFKCKNLKNSKSLTDLLFI